MDDLLQRSAHAGASENCTETHAPDGLISCDSHIVEPYDLWLDAPARFVMKMPALQPGCAIRTPTSLVARLAYQDANGVSAEAVFPTRALQLFDGCDPRGQELAFSIYNQWLGAFCAHSQKRIFGIACIATEDMRSAEAELASAYDAGLVAALINHCPDPSIPFMSAHYERLWAAAAECDMPIALHIGTPVACPSHCSAVAEIMCSVNSRESAATKALFDILFSGALERHRKLKILLAAGQVGWIAPILSQWDRHFDRLRGFKSFLIRRRPSEIFAEQVCSTFEDEGDASVALRSPQHGRFVWANDYPLRKDCVSRPATPKAGGAESPEIAGLRRTARRNAIDFLRLNLK